MQCGASWRGAALGVVLLLASCAGTVRPRVEPSAPPGQGSALSAVPSRELALDVSEPAGASGGRREAAFGVSLGDVRFDPPPREVMRRAVAAELEAAGHRLSPAGRPFRVRIERFEGRTDTTPLYWDVVGVVAISVGVPGAEARYQATCEGRTWVNPSEALFAEVLSRCVDDVVGQLRTDVRLAEALARG